MHRLRQERDRDSFAYDNLRVPPEPDFQHSKIKQHWLSSYQTVTVETYSVAPNIVNTEGVFIKTGTGIAEKGGKSCLADQRFSWSLKEICRH